MTIDKLTKLELKLKVRLMGKNQWNKILKEAGIPKASKVPEKELDAAVLALYKKEFVPIPKDKEINLISLSKTYENGFKAVHDMNLTIKPRDFVCLLGPSGCGKTTALRMLAGLDYITDGSYMMGSKEMNSSHPSERNTAMVFQNYALYPFMTVYNNIAFGLKQKVYSNNYVNDLMAKLIAQEYPKHAEILDLEHEIWELKHEGQFEINILKRKYKSLSRRNKSEEEILAVKKELDAKLLIKKGSAARNAEKIEAIKVKIKEVKAEQSKIRSEVKKLESEKKQKINQEVSQLKSKQNEYKVAKRNDLDKIETSIKLLSEKISIAEKAKNEMIKKFSSELKTIEKTKDKDNAAKMEKLKVSFDSEIQKHFGIIDGLKEELRHAHEEKGVINASQSFAIDELLKMKSAKKQLVNQIFRASVVWKYSIPARVRDVTKVVGLQNLIKRKPSELSGGQRQRVALVRAISKDAQLFLFDEPLSNLDAKLRGAMRMEIRRIHELLGATTLYVTHDQIEAMTMANKVVVMNVGYIQQVGSPKDLYDNPANMFVARFIGTPTINMIPGKLDAKSTRFEHQAFSLDLNLHADKMELIKKSGVKDVILGIRPQYVKIKKLADKAKADITGIVDVSELIGSEYVINVVIGNRRLRVLVPAHLEYKIGDRVSVEFDSENVSLFDAKTGISISSILNEDTQKAIKIWNESADTRIDNKILLEAEKEYKTMTKKAVDKIHEAVSPEFKGTVTKDKINKKINKAKDYSLVEMDEDDVIKS